jgi:hypothetical protein
MKASIFIISVLLASIPTAMAVKGIDLSASFNNFACVKNSGY